MSHSPLQKEACRIIDRLPWLVAGCILVSTFTPSTAATQTLRVRSLVTTKEIVEAMQNHQIPISGVQVRLSVPITSAVPHPQLNVRAIAPLNQHELRLRMACQDPSSCLPFFATASYPEAIDLGLFQTNLDRQPAGNAKLLPASTATAQGTAPPISHKPLDSSKLPVLRSGSMATLDFDEDRIHLRVEVICLESGATGDKIRVTTRDRKQVYLAEIVAPNALKGTFLR